MRQFGRLFFIQWDWISIIKYLLWNELSLYLVCNYSVRLISELDQLKPSFACLPFQS